MEDGINKGKSIPKVSVVGLTKTYNLDKEDFKALDDVSFSVKEGEIYGLIGLSGAGKSTLLRCINKLELADRGQVLIDGENIMEMDEDSLRKVRKKTAMIFQNFNLFNQRTVYQNIAYPLEIDGRSKEEIDKRVIELLNFINLKDKMNEYPKNLSGGQKQRVAIARALAVKPSILLSDEFNSALDPANTKTVLELLKRAVKEFNLTIILITHQMELAKEICHRIGVMEKGKIVEENTVEDLFKNPKHKLTKSFVRRKEAIDLEEIEKLDGRLVNLNFGNETAKKSIVSKVIRTLNIDINILQGSLNKLGDVSSGYLTVEIIGDGERTEEAIKMFKDNSVIVEEVQ